MTKFSMDNLCTHETSFKCISSIPWRQKRDGNIWGLNPNTTAENQHGTIKILSDINKNEIAVSFNDLLDISK